MVIETAPAVAQQAARTTTPVLRVSDAIKSFAKIQALKNASLELRQGELLALLGPNGAGKTTLLRAVTGRVELDQGTVEIFGKHVPPAERRRALGVVPQEIAIYPLLTARENLEAFGRLHGVSASRPRERVDWALDWTGLVDRSREPVKTFSGGMKRRLNIACGVLHEPRIVLLDEPTVGVDPQSRERIYEMLESLRAAGASLLLTTHHLEEAEDRCDRVTILDHGRVIASGTVAELVEQTVGGDRLVVLTLDRSIGTPPPGLTAEPDGNRISAQVRDVGTELPLLLERIGRMGARVDDVEVRRRGLHAVFIHLTGKDLRE